MGMASNNVLNCRSLRSLDSQKLRFCYPVSLIVRHKDVSVEIETIFKLVTATLGIFGVARIIYEFSTGSKNKLREEYRFAKEFLRDIAQEPKLHPLAIEKGYYAIAGTTSIKSKEIEYILSLENPDTCLKDYVLSRQYLEHISKNGNFKVEFSQKYKSDFSRNWRKTVHVLIYFFGSLIALSPFLLFKPLGLNINQFMGLTVITIPVFGFFAFDSLKSFIKIKRGEKLVISQSKHTKLIIVKNQPVKPYS